MFLGARVLGGSSESCLAQHNLSKAYILISSLQLAASRFFSKWAEPSAVPRLGDPQHQGLCGSAPKILTVPQCKPSWTFSLPWNLQECFCNQEAPRWSCSFSSLPVPKTSLAVPKRQHFLPTSMCFQGHWPCVLRRRTAPLHRTERC